MIEGLLPTLAALAGAVVGAAGSFTTTWLNTIVQTRAQRVAAERERRQEVYGRFMDELANAIGMELAADTVDLARLAPLFALKGRICLFASPQVVSVAEGAVRYVIELNMRPAVTPAEVHRMVQPGSTDWMADFARAARDDLARLR